MSPGKFILVLSSAIVAVPPALHAQQAPSGTTQVIEGTWKGEMSCAKLTFTKGPQKVPIEVMISGRSATFSRKVWNQDSSAVVGTEEGTGEVSPAGAIKLDSEWRSAGAIAQYTFKASYTGHLKRGVGSLSGTQEWKFNGKTENRPCSISLKR
jgi:hypothetical protein